MNRSAIAAALLGTALGLAPALAHEGEIHARKFPAGEPGDPAKPAREVRVTMREDGPGRMSFAPARIEVRRGEQVRFVLENEGIYAHEFLIDTPARNAKHGAEMKKNPDMEHADPNGVTVALAKTGQLVWRFTKPGTFEYACLIPGHYEAGMHGTIVVK